MDGCSSSSGSRHGVIDDFVAILNLDRAFCNYLVVRNKKARYRQFVLDEGWVA